MSLLLVLHVQMLDMREVRGRDVACVGGGSQDIAVTDADMVTLKHSKWLSAQVSQLSVS